jgi:6-pyruvoyltetrahydropterin/6-carboxytetrahydropterin synthase
VNDEITVVKEFTFEAAHHLLGYNGKCQNVHGHRWVLLVGFAGRVNYQTGMVLDFTNIKKHVQEIIIDVVDHQDLNEISILGFPAHLPTSENILEWVRTMLLSYMIPAEVHLAFLRLYETATSYAEWRAE